MSDRRVEDCPIKFGPMWLRNFSREGSAGASGGSNTSAGATATGSSSNQPTSSRNPPPALNSNRTQQPATKHKLAKYRYGREEMLALYEEALEPPPGLFNVQVLYVPIPQRPVALITDTVDEEPRDNMRNSLGLNRNLASGGGLGLQPMDRYGAGRGLSDTARGRSRLHQPFNMASNGRGTSHRDDGQYGDIPAPGLTRSWSSGPHPAPRTGDNTDWNQNRPYYKTQTRWTEPNWRRPSSTGRTLGDENDGIRRLQPLGRGRPPLDKRDLKSERPTSWTSNRRPWAVESQFSDEHLPEWAIEGNTESSGGTFDSLGAFHGVDSPNQRSEPFFGLSRSHTQGSIITRSRSHDEETPSASEPPQPSWWNHNKSTGAIPKKFDATKVKFKMPTRTKEDTPGQIKSENIESLFQTALSSQKLDDQTEEDKKKKKNVSFIDDKQVSKTFDALMRMNIKAEEASDERGNFSSVLITPNNTLRQKHQNVMQPQNVVSQNNQSPSPMQSQNAMQSQSPLQSQKTMQSQSPMQSQTPMQFTSTMQSQNALQPQNAVQSQNLTQPQNSIQPQSPLTPSPAEQPQVKQDNTTNNTEMTELDAALMTPVPNSVDAMVMRMFSSYRPVSSSIEGNVPTSGGYTTLPEQSAVHPNDISFRQPVDKQILLRNAALKIVKQSNTWYYEDPHKNVQGPFSTHEMFTWYRAGFFSPDLMIRRACDKHMRPLGSFGDLPPFAESHSEILSIITQEVLLDNVGNDQRPSEGAAPPAQLQQQHLQAGQGPNCLVPTSLQQLPQLHPQTQHQSTQPQPHKQQISLQTGMQSTQMHSVPLQQAQTQMHQSAVPHMHHTQIQQSQAHQQSMQQLQMHQQPGPPRNFPHDMLSNSPYSTSQDLGTQANSILGLQPTYGLDSILLTNAPPTHPPMMPYVDHTNNNFLMEPPVGQPPMVESLWGQTAPNFHWMQAAPVIAHPEAPWENKVPVIPPELPIPEPKSSQPESSLAEKAPEQTQQRADVEKLPTPPLIFRQVNVPAPLILSNLLSQPPPTMAQEISQRPLQDPAIIATSEDIRQLSPPIHIAKPLNESNVLQKAKEPEPHKAEINKIVSPIAEVSKEQVVKKILDKEEKVNPLSPVHSAVEKSTKVTPPVAANQAEKAKAKDGNGKGKKASKAKDKDEAGDKKKSKNEMKIEEVLGFVKAKKEEKKKDFEKKEIREIPAATKASQRACLEKKKVDENKPTEEADKKRKAELKMHLLSSLDQPDKDEVVSLDKLEVQPEKSRQNHSTASKKAPWCANTANSANSPAEADGLSLTEIQRLEREKKFESIKEQQQMVQLIAQQQQAALAREQEITQNAYLAKTFKPKAIANVENVQSLAEIQMQEEIRRRQLREEQAAIAAAIPAPPPVVTHVPWSGNGNTGSATTTQSYMGGFWETSSASAKPDEKVSTAKSNSEAQPSKPSKKTKVASPAKEHSVKEKATPAGEFDSWCVNVLSPWASKIDVPVFVSFLKDIESPYEVKDYVKCYLGEAKDSSDFARNFLEKRSKLLRIAMAAPVDDLCSPAPAKNPTSTSNSDYQEAKGKAKKIKKNKMLKIDARILGFSVTAAEDRINVGDIDSV